MDNIIIQVMKFFCAGKSNNFDSIFCLLIGVSEPIVAQTYRYDLDPEHTTVSFFVDHLGYAKVIGFFHEVSGSYSFNEETGELSEILITVETDSVFTNHRRRDSHLRSEDFLNSRRYPLMTFSEVTAKIISEKTYEITGTLQLLGESKPLTLTAVWNKSGPYPFGDNNYVMGVSAHGSFRRSQFGMDYSVDNDWVGDMVDFMIEFEALRR